MGPARFGSLPHLRVLLRKRAAPGICPPTLAAAPAIPAPVSAHFAAPCCTASKALAALHKARLLRRHIAPAIALGHVWARESQPGAYHTRHPAVYPLAAALHHPGTLHCNHASLLRRTLPVFRHACRRAYLLRQQRARPDARTEARNGGTSRGAQGSRPGRPGALARVPCVFRVFRPSAHSCSPAALPAAACVFRRSWNTRASARPPWNIPWNTVSERSPALPPWGPTPLARALPSAPHHDEASTLTTKLRHPEQALCQLRPPRARIAHAVEG